MSFIGKTNQSIGDNSNAIQATRDIIINGNSTGEVISLCEYIITQKMAALKEEAKIVALGWAREFGQNIAVRLDNTLDEKLHEKLKSPDVQFAINEAVIQVATKGPSAKAELLQELIVSKITNDDEERNLIIDHAIEVTKRTTNNELKLIALIYSIRNNSNTINNINFNAIHENRDPHFSIKGFDKLFCWMLYHDIYTNPTKLFDPIVGDPETLRPINTDMMKVKGLIDLEHPYDKDYFEILEFQTNHKLENNQELFEMEFQYFDSILKKFGINKLEHLTFFRLTTLGEVIAHSYLLSKGFNEVGTE